jgi:hypothetical protein
MTPFNNAVRALHHAYLAYLVWQPDGNYDTFRSWQDEERSSCEQAGKKRETDTKTLEISYDECAYFAASLLHERETMLFQGLKATPILDALILRLHAVYPEQDWIRFVR